MWSLNAATPHGNGSLKGPQLVDPFATNPQTHHSTQEEEEGKKDHQHGPYASYYGGLCFAVPKYHNVFIEVWECPDHYLGTKAEL